MNKFLKISLIGILSIVLLVGAFSGGFVTGNIFPVNRPAVQLPGFVPTQILPSPGVTTTPGITDTPPPADLETLFKPFWEAWQIAHDQFVDQPVDDVKLMRGAIRGMLEALEDDHTSYMDPQEYTDATTSLEGEYEGIGAWVDTSGDFLTIVTPMPGSPAEKAGLKPGDKIIAIDGKDMSGTTPEAARLKVLGKAGSTVILTVQREGIDDPLDFTIVRGKITVPSAEGKMLENNIAYVRIYTFGDNTTRELRDALREVMAQNPSGLVVDLRNNGGGYLRTSIEVASEFIPEGVVMIERYGDGKRDVFEALRGGQATEIPIVVLINEGTASASEIVAGAIQDYGRGMLVGVTSFGKGSVQNWVPLENNQGAVRVTIAKWMTPKERTIEKIGLTPDVVVEMTDEDRAADRDPQLDRAVELLLQP